MRTARAAWVVALTALVSTAAHADPPTPAQVWRDATIQSGPTDREEPPHPEALHEWWYFAVQNPAGGGACGAWQAMATFLSDRETAKDMLLFTAVVEGVPYNFTQEFLPGNMSRTSYAGDPIVTLGDSSIDAAGGHWDVEVRTAGAKLRLTFDAPAARWRRSAPEGAGFLGITFAPRMVPGGSLRVEDRECAITGSGYFEHVWGNWSRVPMWGVDFLNVHLDNGWSAYARRTPMRGEANLYPALGLRPEDAWPSVLVVSDGAHLYEAREVKITLTESTETIPELGIKRPAAYTVTGKDFSNPEGGSPPGTVTFEISGIVTATIPLPTTSSGVVEGWGVVEANIDGVSLAGTSEVEMQRYGTRYPH